MSRTDTPSLHSLKSDGSFSPGECCNTLKDDTAFRGNLLHLADQQYRAGEELKSIECQIETLCLGFRTKFFSSGSSFDNDFTLKFLQNLESHAEDRSSDFKPNLSWDDVKAMGKDLKPRKAPKSGCQEHVDAKILVKRCQSLPDVWTVLHLCKNFDQNGVNSLQSEIISHNVGIYLTLLKYPRSEINNHEPICVYLPPFEEENLFKLVQDITMEQERILKTTDIDKEIYYAHLKKLNDEYFRLVTLLIKWVGPWVTFFQGRPKEADESRENEIFSLVDDFVAKKKLTARQRILLSCVCCFSDRLEENDMKIAAEEIAQNQKEYKSIVEFLSTENFPSTEDESRFPTIIIVDELLDQFPWELMIPESETARVSSLHILLRLFDKYKRKIKNGYLHLDIKHGSSLINPDGDLLMMEKRMVQFLNYWLPEWKKTVRQVPTSEELRNILESSDIFLFCGHGNALKYIKPQDLIRDTLNCVVMLFGCDSVKLKGNGFRSEMFGAHLYYHYVLCPLVIGSKNIISDFPTDQLSVRVLSTWFKSDASKHFALCDIKSFKEGKIEFKKNSKPIWESQKNPSILGIFADIRCTDSLAVWLRAAIVLRGLPIWLACK